jgi:NAD(P)-dependent dehydrogenase (short-subunit alcohol dehydrogenase family)
MDLGLRDQIVLVTGASKGIGFACAQAFVREGARVALVSRSRANLDAAVAKIESGVHRPQAFAADLTDAAQALAMVDAAETALGAIDVLVSSAGAAKRYPPDELGPRA